MPAINLKSFGVLVVNRYVLFWSRISAVASAKYSCLMGGSQVFWNLELPAS